MTMVCWCENYETLTDSSDYDVDNVYINSRSNHTDNDVSYLKIDRFCRMPKEGAYVRFVSKIEFEKLLNLTSLMLLRSGDVERNPGPENSMVLVTQNCRGLKMENKMRQL